MKTKNWFPVEIFNCCDSIFLYFGTLIHIKNTTPHPALVPILARVEIHIVGRYDELVLFDLQHTVDSANLKYDYHAI
jgi:hypothetical protein